tara:strand:- start:268 stop:1245 length:978 start_codon:yes stop_codon:yes gene_type:complete
MKHFIRENFFPIKNDVNIDYLINLLGEDILSSSVLNNFKVIDISSLSITRDKSILFLEKEINIENIKSRDIHVISSSKENLNFYKSISIVKNLDKAYNIITNHLFFHDDYQNMPDEYQYLNGSYISKFSKIDKSCNIGKNCFISRGVEIGKNCIIKNNVVIKNSIIGNSVIISDGSCVGTTGFGFDFNKRGSIHLNPQLGIVIIEDNVHIGSLCTVDRGKIDITQIGKNSMIDNMVHIAHNVIIGKNSCIAAQTGISGSVTIGDNVTIGGQVGFAGHITIGENVIIAAKSGVTKNIKDNSVVAGFPAIDMKEWKKNIIRQKKYGH